jgi:hypothetical protein
MMYFNAIFKDNAAMNCTAGPNDRTVWGVGFDRFEAETVGWNSFKAWMFCLVYSSSFNCHPVFDVI